MPLDGNLNQENYDSPVDLGVPISTLFSDKPMGKSRFPVKTVLLTNPLTNGKKNPPLANQKNAPPQVWTLAPTPEILPGENWVDTEVTWRKIHALVAIIYLQFAWTSRCQWGFTDHHGEFAPLGEVTWSRLSIWTWWTSKFHHIFFNQSSFLAQATGKKYLFG